MTSITRATMTFAWSVFEGQRKSTPSTSSAASSKFEARAVSRLRRQRPGLWIAYEEGPEQWGQGFRRRWPRTGKPALLQRPGPVPRRLPLDTDERASKWAGRPPSLASVGPSATPGAQGQRRSGSRRTRSPPATAPPRRSASTARAASGSPTRQKLRHPPAPPGLATTTS